MGFFQRWAQRRVARKDAERAKTLDAPLGAGERVEWTGVAEWMDFTARHGRGRGEGMLFITSARVIFKLNLPPKQEFGVPFDDIREVRWDDLPVPRMVALDLRMNDGSGMLFYTGMSAVEVLYHAHPER